MIPTSFPATAVAASGPGTWQDAASRPAGHRSTEPRGRHFRYLGRHLGVYLGSVCCHGPSCGVLGPDVVGAGGAVCRAAGVAARVWDRQGDGAEVGHAVPDLDQAGRPWPGRGALGGGAAGRPAAPAPVPADARGAGQRGGGAGRYACPGPGRCQPAGWAPGCGAGVRWAD